MRLMYFVRSILSVVFSELKSQLEDLTLQLQDKQDYVTSLQDELDGSASTTANQREELHAKTHDVKILDERVKRLQEALDRERMKNVQQAGAQAGGGGGNEGAENEKLRRDLLSKTRQIENLEEQLRRHTSHKLQRMRKGAASGVNYNCIVRRVLLLKSAFFRRGKQGATADSREPTSCKRDTTHRSRLASWRR